MVALDPQARKAACIAFMEALPDHGGRMTSAELILALNAALLAYERERGKRGEPEP